MAFQRSYSKVWWGSSFPENSVYNNFTGGNDTSGGGFHSLDSNIKWSGNLSKIQEADESSKSWSSHSPGSLRSQDSGFSDHDEPALNNLNTSNNISPSKSEGSSQNSSIRTVQTPPTVIRRKPELSPLCASRRISFSAPSSPIGSSNQEYDIMRRIDRISILNNTPSNEHLEKHDDDGRQGEQCFCSSKKDKSIKRRRVRNLNVRRSILHNNNSIESSIGSDDDGGDNNNNLTNHFKKELLRTPNKKENFSRNLFSPQEVNSQKDYISPQFNVSTSTPKNTTTNSREKLTKTIIYLDNSLPGSTLPNNDINSFNFDYNITPPPVQYWLNDLRMSYNHEVMSTLQTKSIAQEAFRNLKITTTTVAKIIRQLQTRSLILQGQFERTEKILRSGKNLKDILSACQDLIESVYDLSKSLERRSVFFTECRNDRKKFDGNIDHIRWIVKDLRISFEKQHYLDVESISDDIQVLKRYILITIRLVFEKLIRIIVLNIENSKCDLMLRANLNMVSTLSNIDYTGFASLNDAFIKNDAVRIFLMLCIDSKFSSVRALALRALATICSSTESIRELGETGGVEIIKDIISCEPSNNSKRTEPEKREAVSLVTQITAPWHGTDHKVPGLKDCVESFVEGLSDIIEKTNCCQTLLLCAASLNNLSRLEVTSIYSIMSNESVIKLKEAVERRGPGVSIFLYEQIVGILYNMSGNKKCHSHLANRNIISFITFIFQSQFYEKYSSRAETDAHRRTIKTILHIFARLIHESVVGQDILEQNFVPIFSKIEKSLQESQQQQQQQGQNGDSEYMKDISYLTRQMNESLTAHKSFNRSTESRSSTSSNSGTTRFNLTRQESYV